MTKLGRGSSELGKRILAVLFFAPIILLIGPFHVAHWIYRKLTGGQRARRSPAEVLSAAEAGTDARRLWRKMRALAQTTLLLAPDPEGQFSKMGGEPELPPRLPWPTGSDGPRPFLAQFDLAAVRAAGGPEWLPEAGALYLFDDEPGDAGDLVRVIYAPEQGSTPSPPPATLPAQRLRPERRVKFLSFTSIPSLDWLGENIEALDLEDDEMDALADAPDEPFGDEVQHRIGGYPSELQNEQLSIMAELASRGLTRDHSRPLPRGARKASADWRLLFQADSDRALNMDWAGGRLYVFVREADAREADFSKTVTLWQTD